MREFDGPNVASPQREVRAVMAVAKIIHCVPFEYFSREIISYAFLDAIG